MKAFISVLLPLPVPLKTRFPGGRSYMDASVLATRFPPVQLVGLFIARRVPDCTPAS